MEAFHQSVLARAVDRASGSVSKAAERLGLPRASLYRMLQQLRDEEAVED
jgi:DNA-binding IclR family transcriptional regulator